MNETERIATRIGDLPVGLIGLPFVKAVEEIIIYESSLPDDDKPITKEWFQKVGFNFAGDAVWIEYTPEWPDRTELKLRIEISQINSVPIGYVSIMNKYESVSVGFVRTRKEIRSFCEALKIKLKKENNE